MLLTKLVYEKDIPKSIDITRFSLYRQSKLSRCRNPKARICSICASLALEHALAELGYSEHDTEYAENEFGKPFFASIPNLYFSVSHTNGLAVCAVSDRSVGIDCESVDREVPPSVLQRFFTAFEISAYERSPIELWTLKEAYTKMCGLPFSECVRDIELPFFEAETEITGVHFEKKSLNGFVISVAQNKLF